MWPMSARLAEVVEVTAASMSGREAECG